MPPVLAGVRVLMKVPSAVVMSLDQGLPAVGAGSSPGLSANRADY
jgi:hypothetical protein